jgi:hypothetical protein
MHGDNFPFKREIYLRHKISGYHSNEQSNVKTKDVSLRDL